VELSKIDRPSDMLRMEIDEKEIDGLSKSILHQGLLHPILLKKRGERFEIVAGDRRFLAHKLLRKKTILARVVDITSKAVSLARALENVGRRDLSPFEEGMAYLSLYEKHKLSLDMIAEQMGKSVGLIKRRIDITQMPEDFQKAIHKKLVPLSVAEEIMLCPDAGHRVYLLEMAVDHGVTRDVARMWVSDFKKDLRTRSTAGADGGLHRSVMTAEVIYKACAVCREATDIQKMEQVGMCTGCLQRIIEALGKGE